MHESQPPHSEVKIDCSWSYNGKPQATNKHVGLQLDNYWPAVKFFIARLKSELMGEKQNQNPP